MIGVNIGSRQPCTHWIRTDLSLDCCIGALTRLGTGSARLFRRQVSHVMLFVSREALVGTEKKSHKTITQVVAVSVGQWHTC